MREAIILAGGKSYRMKPYFMWNKALLPFGKETLLDKQIKWLQEHSFDKVIVAIDEQTYLQWENKSFDPSVQVSVEWKKLGTSGALFRAFNEVESQMAYVMNVDDILLNFNPIELYNSLNKGAIVALHKPRIGFGLARLHNGLVTRFQEKPTVKYWVSCGHYVFRKSIVRDYFMEEGDFEPTVLPRLAKDKQLQGYKVRAKWITVNTYKDYLNALRELKLLKKTKLPYY